MTVLAGLDRLESPALWRPEAGAQRRNVYVAIGEAELVVQDEGGTALSHWSLPALERRNPGAMPARYAPDPDAAEELEIDEPEMVAALDRVVAAVARGRRRPGALRRAGIWALAAGVLGIAALWLPDALRDHARNVMPPAQRVEIGQRMLTELAAGAGPACATRTGTEALATLRARILPTQATTIVVLRDLPADALALPGGLIALSDRPLAAQDDPNVAAGHVLAAALGARARPPVADMLDGLGLVALVRLLASGRIDDAALSARAAALMRAPPPLPSPDRLRAGFDAARLAWTPWAAAAGLPDSPTAPSDMPPALEDTAWQALREICLG